MQTKVPIAILIATFLLILQGCGDSSSGPDETETTEVTGTVTAPDGDTPLAGATVYVSGEGANKVVAKAKGVSSSTLNAGDCEEPQESYAAYTCTEADGSFTFDVPVSSSDVLLKIFKGIFAFEQTIDISGGSGEIGEVNMPSASESFDGEIAVVEGAWDRMEDILAKVGFGEVETDESSSGYGQLVPGTEQFDLLDNSAPLFEDNDGDGERDLFNYDIVFINCGASEAPVYPSKAKTHNHAAHLKSSGDTEMLSSEDRDALKTYVEEGGILYATDLAYDYVEQTFPSFVDYYGSEETPADEREGIGNAEVGNSGIETDGSVLQDNLESWLANVDCFEGESCLNSDDTVHITDFLAGWGVIKGPHSGATDAVTQWVEGDVEWSGGSGVRPLTVSFEAGEGSVFYSSYHTVESEFTPHWRPQERLLQFLVFE
ncbi:hypothetical protein SAMN05443144_10723 [Fodinibius roseus]|uniref:Carboxypeptidase regulatory-like domain-containing protein n=1 Tax=Fodinibius roseus TaxID=1194090 RepID=A0A1M5AC78_9BACT|nr:hypothetical protein [Fodinibius roseus]SHF27931.1 hypothetical protein SAMN05443144_10723 [Fodinibius roseus]